MSLVRAKVGCATALVCQDLRDSQLGSEGGRFLHHYQRGWSPESVAPDDGGDSNPHRSLFGRAVLLLHSDTLALEGPILVEQKLLFASFFRHDIYL